MSGALSGNWPERMGIDRGHRRAHDFKVRPGITLSEQNLQIPAKSVSWIGITKRGRFSKQKDAIGVRGFGGFHDQRRRASRQRRGEKAQAEICVLNIDEPPAEARFEEESR